MPGCIPNASNARYYAQRAHPTDGAGLIISEATCISEQARGYYATPGIHTPEQVEGWKRVTDAVHAKGGLIACQLWHVGRVSHASLQPDGQPPVGPTSVPSQSKTYVDASMERVPTSVPRALEAAELPGIVEQFAHAARCAKEANFDAVEIHGANTYLLDQFTRDGMNTRNDAYGGTLAKRLRLPLEVSAAVCGAFGAGGVGYRISPLSEHHDARDSDPAGTFAALAGELGALGVAYLHAVETWDRSAADERLPWAIPRIVDAFRRANPSGIYVANGDYTYESASAAIQHGWCDAVAFGKAFISNPDLAHRFRHGLPLTPWDSATFYGGGEAGYTTYPDAGEDRETP